VADRGRLGGGRGCFVLWRHERCVRPMRCRCPNAPRVGEEFGETGAVA
jgi:hypothetical protein